MKFNRNKIFLIFLAIIITIILGLVFYGQKTAKLLFVGDLNFDRYMREVINEKGGDFIFSCIGNSLKEADLVIGNLEGPITDNPSVSVGTEIGSPANYTFTFPPVTAELLHDYNIKLVNIGNNHISNFKESGVVSTKNYLEKAEVNYFGGINGDEPIYRTRLGRTNVSFISFNQFGGDTSEKIADKIENENKNGRLVIVYAHWGEEYGPITDYQKNIAKLFVKSGAKAIIGSHPHIISPSEKIGDTIIYYSLGNFVFDQYWNSEVRTGLMLELDIKDSQITISEHKVVLDRDGRTCLATN